MMVGSMVIQQHTASAARIGSLLSGRCLPATVVRKTSDVPDRGEESQGAPSVALAPRFIKSSCIAPRGGGGGGGIAGCG